VTGDTLFTGMYVCSTVVSGYNFQSIVDCP
jgi:hypothetical protein